MTVDKLRFNLGNTNYDVPTKEYVDDLVSNSTGNTSFSLRGRNDDTNAIGVITYQYTLLRNHLKLDGTSVKASDYLKLVNFVVNNNLIGTSEQYNANKALFMYDESNDILTLPNFLDKTVWGGNTIIEKSAGLPNIKSTYKYMNALAYLDKNQVTNQGGTIGTSSTQTVLGQGAIRWEGDPAWHGVIVKTERSDNQEAFNRLYFNASWSNSIYSDSNTTVQPPAIQLIPQIRYETDVINMTGIVPIGTIISYMGLTAPDSYLACDGTVYNISQYSVLAKFINNQFNSVNYFGGDGIDTFAVPDLRGEFLRGTGTNSHTNQGNGANVGVHQNSTEQNIFVMSNDSDGRLLIRAIDSNDYQQIDLLNRDSIIPTTKWVGGHFTELGRQSGGSVDGKYTSRPTNTSVLYCIKYN